MAAHALTILRQSIATLTRKGCAPSDTVVRQVADSLHDALSCAPGFDLPAGFDMGDWETLWDVVETVRGNGPEHYRAHRYGPTGRPDASPSAFLCLLSDLAGCYLWQDSFPCAEAVAIGRHSFIRYGRPHWRKRSRAFDAHDSRAIATARKLAASAGYGMERRSPVIADLAA